MDAMDFAVGIGVLCFGLGLFYFKVKILVLRLALHVLVPAVIAYGAYWIPNLECWGEPEYHGWDFVVVLMVLMIATPASVMADVLGALARRLIGH